MNSFVPNVETASISRHLLRIIFLNHVHVRELQFLLHGDSYLLLLLAPVFCYENAFQASKKPRNNIVHRCKSGDPQLMDVPGEGRELSHFENRYLSVWRCL